MTDDPQPRAVWKHPPNTNPEAWRDKTQPRRQPWTVGRAATTLLLFVVILVSLSAGGCVALVGIADATNSGIGSCGFYGSGAALVVYLFLFGIFAVIPASVYLTFLALRRLDGR